MECVRECHFPSLFVVTLERMAGKSVAGGMAFPHVITNELLRSGQTHSEPTKRGPWS